MPFVPLNARKPLIPVILDDDKEALRAEQRAKDDRTVSLHFGTNNPSATGYRYGKHEATFGLVRGPQVPFRHATSTWKPPEHGGPAEQRAKDQAAHGAFYDGSHTLRTMRSAPSLYSTGDTSGNKPTIDTSELTHPLAVELKRWEKFSRFSKTEVANSPVQLPEPQYTKAEEKTEKKVVSTGLVNFPKYMLIHNCHLRAVDQKRYVQEEAAKRAAAEEAAARVVDSLDALASTPDLPSSSVRFKEASWAAPKLRSATDSKANWAGSALPHGRGQRSSNPFRMG